MRLYLKCAVQKEFAVMISKWKLHHHDEEIDEKKLWWFWGEDVQYVDCYRMDL